MNTLNESIARLVRACDLVSELHAADRCARHRLTLAAISAITLMRLASERLPESQAVLAGELREAANTLQDASEGR